MPVMHHRGIEDFNFKTELKTLLLQLARDSEKTFDHSANSNEAQPNHWLGRHPSAVINKVLVARERRYRSRLSHAGL